MYRLRLFSNPNISYNRKTLAKIPGNTIWEGDLTSVGAFTRENLLVDNGATISCPYYLASRANFVELRYDEWVVIGFIVDVKYINEGATEISWLVDGWSSAIASQKVKNIGGLLNKASVKNDDLDSNLQSDEFGVGNQVRLDQKMTVTLNTQAGLFDGIIAGKGMVAVLTVSWQVYRLLGKPKPFTFYDTMPVFTPVTDEGLQSTSFAVFAHYGSYFTGFPICFSGRELARDFIKLLTSATGGKEPGYFVTKMPSNGLSKQHMDTHHSMVILYNGGSGGQVGYKNKNSSGSEIESTYLISLKDFFSLSMVPKFFTTDKPNSEYRGFVINTGAVNGDKKLQSYPYSYYKIVGINGTEWTVIPQTHVSDGTIKGLFRYVGGLDNRIEMTLLPKESMVPTPFDPTTSYEWKVVKSFPRINVGGIDTGAIASSMEVVKNAGNAAEATRSSGWGSYILTGIGTIINIAAVALPAAKLLKAGTTAAKWGWGLVSTAALGAAGAATQAVDNTLGISSDIAAKNAALTPVTQGGGGGGLNAGPSQISTMVLPPYSVWRCGGSDSELHALQNIWAAGGQPVNSMYDCFTGKGELPSGCELSPGPYGQFLKYASAVITGEFPEKWKIQMRDVCLKGFYLI